MTCHAAIVSRELQVPCVVGTGNATTMLQTGARSHGRRTYWQGTPVRPHRSPSQKPTQPLPEPVSPLATRLYVNLAVAGAC